MQHKEHHFIVEEATKYGVEKAILLYNIRFWLDKNKANDKHIHQHSNGKYYYFTYNSGTAFGKLFPYMNAKSINRWLLELENDGILISGNFNNTSYDRTKWYSIIQEFEYNEKSITLDEKSITLDEQSNTLDEQPIPDNNTHNNTNNNTLSCAADAAPDIKNETDSTNLFIDTPPPVSEPTDLKPKKDKQTMTEEDFGKFWNIYPRKKGKGDALKKFLKINKDKFDVIIKAVGECKKTKQWQDVQYIPFPGTWLNQERWEDESSSTDYIALSGEEQILARQKVDDSYQRGEITIEDVARAYVAISNDTLETGHCYAIFPFSTKYGDQMLLKLKNLFPNF